MFRINRKAKSKLQWDKVQDSGVRNAFTTGSQRDTQDGKGRYDLIPTTVLKRLAQHYENGAIKYGDNNWQKGQPLHQYYNSAVRHLNAIVEADLSEDHFAAAIWNIAAMIHHVDAMLDGSLPIELDSFGIVKQIKGMEDFDKLKTYTGDTTTYTAPTWTPVMTSGELHTFPTPTAKAYDKDRFKEKEHKKYRTAKLDPEELG
jgi:dATP/dGTP diphosphohydrolase